MYSLHLPSVLDSYIASCLCLALPPDPEGWSFWRIQPDCLLAYLTSLVVLDCQPNVNEHLYEIRESVWQAERIEFEAEAKQRAQDSLNRYGEQEVCKYSGVIINSEESRLRDHKAGKNYRYSQSSLIHPTSASWKSSSLPSIRCGECTV